jgi:hypothetical protein
MAGCGRVQKLGSNSTARCRPGIDIGLRVIRGKEHDGHDRGGIPQPCGSADS